MIYFVVFAAAMSLFSKIQACICNPRPPPIDTWNCGCWKHLFKGGHQWLCYSRVNKRFIYYSPIFLVGTPVSMVCVNNWNYGYWGTHAVRLLKTARHSWQKVDKANFKKVQISKLVSLNPAYFGKWFLPVHKKKPTFPPATCITI